MRHSAAVAL